MKVFLYIFAAILAVLALTHGIESTKQQCEEEGLTFGKGEKVTLPGKCEQATCVNPEFQEISFQYCTTYFPRPECHVTKPDLTKDYPACCPKVKC